MVNRKALIKEFYKNNILFILIGGFAVQMYRGPRTACIIDLAVRTLDIDAIIEIMYTHGYYLIAEIKNDKALLLLSAPEAGNWVESVKAGALTFISVPEKPVESLYPVQKINVSTRMDFLFEAGIPIMKLKKNSKVIPLDDFEILLASMEDLLTLKEQIKNKTEADYADIEYLTTAIKKKGQNKPGR
jgi:hypothetical protein